MILQPALEPRQNAPGVSLPDAQAQVRIGVGQATFNSIQQPDEAQRVVGQPGRRLLGGYPDHIEELAPLVCPPERSSQTVSGLFTSTLLLDAENVNFFL